METAKSVSISRLLRAVVNLRAWRDAVDSQGAMHLWGLLAAKKKGISTSAKVSFVESDDRDFWDSYMRVRDTQKPYFDPLTAEFRIESHYHSNVATARKNTFVGRWSAATYEIDGDDERWQLTSDYLNILSTKLISKGGKETKVPAPDLVAWLYRNERLEPTTTVASLLTKFRNDFHLTPAEFDALFSEVPGDGWPDPDAQYLADHPVRREVVVAIATDPDHFDLTETLNALNPHQEETVQLSDVVRLTKEGRRQVIVQGPPGTGKTYLVKRVAASLLGASDSDIEGGALEEFLAAKQFGEFSNMEKLVSDVNEAGGVWDIIQFHPSYNYEDFVRGITSRIDEEGKAIFRNENRIFGTLAELSAITDAPVVLIVDEINRGDLSKVLGELVYALEYRGEAVRSMYDVEGSALLTVGQNFFLLATMNTADRSIALIDYAIRRRFDFVDLYPDREALSEYIASSPLKEVGGRIVELYDVVQALFAPGSDYAVGHSYFMATSTETLATRIVFQVLPLLAEYAKEGLLSQNTTIGLPDWPGSVGLPLHHKRPFDVKAELKSWLDAGSPLTAPTTDEIEAI